MPNRLLMLVYGPEGTRYDIPPYIINEPFRYGCYDATETLVNYAEEVVNLTLRHVSNGDVRLKLSNCSYVSEVKTKYLNEMLLQGSKLKLFYNGQELDDEAKIVRYNVKDNTVILVKIEGP